MSIKSSKILTEEELLQEGFLDKILPSTIVVEIDILLGALETTYGNWKEKLKSKDPKQIEPILKQIDISYEKIEDKTNRLKQLLNDLNNAKTQEEKNSINQTLQKEFPPLPPTPTLDKQNISGFADVLKQKVSEDPSPSQILDSTLDKILNKYGKPTPEDEIDILEIAKFIEDFKINENIKEKNIMVITEAKLKQIINEELEAMIEEGLFDKLGTYKDQFLGGREEKAQQRQGLNKIKQQTDSLKGMLPHLENMKANISALNNLQKQAGISEFGTFGTKAIDNRINLVKKKAKDLEIAYYEAAGRKSMADKLRNEPETQPQPKDQAMVVEPTSVARKQFNVKENKK